VRATRALRASLERRFRVVETAIKIGGRTLSIRHPASAEDLITEEDFVRDERLPYWAELWPSSRILAEKVIALKGSGRTALELGCGAGLVATCAGLAGFSVCATDYYEDALRFARVNAWENGAGEMATRLVDWRRLPRDLGHYDVVIGSDVLYEMSYGAVIAGALAATLKADGEALIADPGRVARDSFIAETARCGLNIVGTEPVAFREGLVRQTITVFRVRRR